MPTKPTANAEPRPPTDAQASQFDMVQPLLAAAQKEMVELSKKKQDGVVNELKIRHINRLLDAVEEALEGDPSTQFLEHLDDEELPQNSDAVLVLSQWLAAMAQFKDRNCGRDTPYHDRRWFTVERPRQDQ